MFQTNYNPLRSLQPFIDRYWSFESDAENGIDLFPLLAGTGLDLLIHFAGPFQTEKEKLPSSHIFCPRQTIDITSKDKLNFIAIRFRCGAFRHFCPINFRELNNRFLSVQDIWGKEGRELTEKLNNELSTDLRIDILDSFFLKQLEKHGKNNQLLDSSISYIYKHFEDVAIHALATNLNISLRHFERLFKEEFGISPKRYQRTSRFQSALKELLLSSDNDYMQAAIHNGYYDQSHFIKECKTLSGMPPLELLRMKNKKQHFYFKKYSYSSF